MEIRVWKTILLQWVQKCNFIENITSLENSDIEAFFAFYAQYAQVKLPASPSSVTIPLELLQTFLRDNYPNFEPRLELDGRIVAADYIYVYTLLMHYTCVQSPSEYFQNICTNLPYNIQQYIAEFFQQTIKKPQMTRNHLHETIVSIPVSVQNKSNGSNSMIDSNTLDSASLDDDTSASTNPATPKTVKRELINFPGVSLMPAPPTPKTELLEQCTRELLGLRAQLETERYEKTVLEEQILENEHLIDSLTKENVVKKKQLTKFTATLQDGDDNENTYMHSYVPNEFENLKKQLLKKLSNKDTVLAKKNEEMHELISKHGKLASKLKMSEDHVLFCIDRIGDLERQLENMSQLLTDKDDNIACLQRDKLELQQCLQETRAELHNGREVLNASLDFLETSQSADSMNTTPENLACSVIDKQLREKEEENDELRKHLTAIVEEKSNLLWKLLKIMKPFQMEMPAAPDVSQLVCLNEPEVDQLSVHYEQELQRVRELQVQYYTLKQQNMQYAEYIQEQIKNKAEKFDRVLEETQLTLLSSIDKLQKRDKEIGHFANICQELEKKDEQLAQVGCELIQRCSQTRILEEQITGEREYSFSQRPKLNSQEVVINSQKDQLFEQRQHLNDIKEQLQYLIDMVGAKFNQNTTSSATSESCLVYMKNMLICLLTRICNQDKDKKSENLLNQHCRLQSSRYQMNVSIQNLPKQQHNAANTNQFQFEQELKTITEKAKLQSIDQTQLMQQLEDERHERYNQTLEKAHVEQELMASHKKQKQLEQKLMEQTELLQKGESTSQSHQDQIMIQRQQLDKQQRELNALQYKLEVAEQQVKTAEAQLHKQESLLIHINKLQDAIKEEQHANLSLKQEQLQQMEHTRIVEKDFKAIQYMLEKREEELEKSKVQLESSTKRLEKVAIKLGEHQALLSKTQREVTQFKLAQKEQAELIKALQHDKESLQLELQKNKERANRLEEKQASLAYQRVFAEAAQTATYGRTIKLERDCKKTNSTIIQDLQLQVNDVEKEKVSLILEMGGLNSEIVHQQKRIADLSAQLQQANETIDEMRSSMQTNEKNACNAQEQELDRTRLLHESIQYQPNDKIEQPKLENKNSIGRETYYQRKLNIPKDEPENSNDEASDSHKSQDRLIETLESYNSNQPQMQEMQEQLEQHRAKAHQREIDCQILQAKYRETKEEINRCEQKLKDQRLEMEGKLEKMKTKMRALYTAEVTRIKEKQERDAATNKVKMEKFSVQSAKYEEHTQKLSNQIVRLNEKILEQQKQLTILSTKLRHRQEADQATTALAASDEWQPFKRPRGPPTNLGSNLAMEDEEGEVFNNTYLTDLKLGSVPNMTAKELHHRNSLQPPHLKSAYAAQYNLDAHDDDFKNGPLSLDDSMSALLSTTEGNGAGTRKKSMGTHYKRPGPPTPSKNGGRLSFGSMEPPREILRETSDNNGIAKTPARFKIFASRFSIGSSGIGGGGHCLSSVEVCTAAFRRCDQRNLFSVQLHVRAAPTLITSK
ncbi:nucleoprotein TPR isoform X2 [Drosophila novamexicana]|uniref:nucleoprotein TPR isoform X2 n=1 Tax=Drosophila novamexicana TaxID=47314 RepID=UPI0011E58E83|nr:nucleoprotein TPR isoform X2 [Drosophila novamexicana]